MSDFSIFMALVDYIPVFLFAIASVMLQRDFYYKMSKGAFALFAAGTIDVVFAGFCKATFKLLYAANICNFEPLKVLFFPVISVGFLLAGLGMVAMLTHKQTENKALCVVPPVLFKGTFIMVGFMIVGLGMMYWVLSVLSVRLKKKAVIPVLIISFFCFVGMGYLSSKDFTSALWNWIAQCINILGELTLILSVLMLRKAGLSDLQLGK